MRRWQACRPPRIEPTLKPEVLHWQCRLDGGAYKCIMISFVLRKETRVPLFSFQN